MAPLAASGEGFHVSDGMERGRGKNTAREASGLPHYKYNSRHIILRGTIVNRTYGVLKNYIIPHFY